MNATSCATTYTLSLLPSNVASSSVTPVSSSGSTLDAQSTFDAITSTFWQPRFYNKATIHFLYTSLYKCQILIFNSFVTLPQPTNIAAIFAKAWFLSHPNSSVSVMNTSFGYCLSADIMGVASPIPLYDVWQHALIFTIIIAWIWAN